MRSPLRALVLALPLVCLASAPRAQERVFRHVVAPGGESTDGTYSLDAVVGQPTIGEVSEPAHTAQVGYLYAAKSYVLGTLLSVTITAFDARIEDNAVHLSWAIGEAVDLEGFNIYRSETEDGTYIKLQNSLLEAEEGFGFADEDVRPGTQYWYRLGAVDRDGEFFSPIVSVVTPAWQTGMEQNYPNPFNPSTTIDYYLAQPERVLLRVYDVRGKLVRELVNERRNFGKHKVTWDGINDHGESVSSGIYFYRLIAGNKSFTRKMALIK
jgi:hypothetical protein